MRPGLAAVAVGLVLFMPHAGHGQEPYPTRTVRLLVGAAPGGNPDVIGRLLAARFSETLGQAFVVENMPGAGGVLAANTVAKAQADGHVLLIGDSGALSIAAAINPSLSYQPLRDFTPITALATVPTVLVANSAVPARSLAEFIAYARKQGHKLSYGSPGPGSIHHLTMAIFADRAGIDMVHVPYRGGTPMVNGLLTGEIQAAWSGIPNVLPLVDSGKVHGYCLSILERSKSLPSLPTCAELGYADFDIATMMGLQGPTGLPQRVVTVLQAAAAKIMREPAIAERMLQLGMVMQENGTAHYRQFMKEDVQRYAQAVEKLNLQIGK